MLVEEDACCYARRTIYFEGDWYIKYLKGAWCIVYFEGAKRVVFLKGIWCIVYFGNGPMSCVRCSRSRVADGIEKVAPSRVLVLVECT